jgi:hypothetical protein
LIRASEAVERDCASTPASLPPAIDLVEKLGGRPPMTLDAFITKNRRAYE